jgi:multicomponent Na+:H+ antiporter subunit A
LCRVTSRFFGVGVYVLVVGLVLDLLRSLGSGIDRHILHGDPTDAAQADVPVPVAAVAAGPTRPAEGAP